MKSLTRKAKKSLYTYFKKGPTNIPKFEKLESGKYKCQADFGVLFPCEKELSFKKPCNTGLFETFELLFCHLLYHHRIPNLFSCKKCEKIFIGEINLHHHERHTCLKNGVQLKCLKCPSIFTNWNQLAAHLRTLHKMSVILKCPNCENFYHTKAEYEAHVKQRHPEHLPESLKCKTCLKAFSSKSNLNRHQKNVHKVAKIGENVQSSSNMIKIGASFYFKCPHKNCPTRCFTNDLLVHHMKEAHSKKQSNVIFFKSMVVCEFCRKYILANEMKRHKETIHFRGKTVLL